MDEIREVIAITEEYGLWHPQEGVVTGYYHAIEPQKIQQLGQLRQGVIKVVGNTTFSPNLVRKYTVAGLITGCGVAEAVHHYYRLWPGTELRGQRAIIQGWGNVGAAVAYYLAGPGVRIVGIIDRAGGLLNVAGFGLEEIRALLLAHQGNVLTADNLLSFEEMNEKVWSMGADIFIPAVSSCLVARSQVEQLLAGGLKIISCGANVPFADPEIFFGPTGVSADERTAVIPDFIANCGMARVFAHLMETGAEITDQAIFADTSRIIGAALARAHVESAQPTGIAQRSFEMALRQLV